MKVVRRALRTFDQAAIHTIHAFCQRALQEAPFAAAMPFAFEMEADDAALRFEMAADFWREQVEPVAHAHPAFAAWLVAQTRRSRFTRRATRAASEKAVGAVALGRARQAVAMAPIRKPVSTAACAIWHAERDAIVSLLAQAQERLSKTTHKPDHVSAAIAAWSDYFAQGDCHAPPPRAALKLTVSALKKATKVKFEPPEHPFFEHAEALAAAVVAAEAAQRVRWLELVQTWLDYAPAELVARKRTRRVVSFDDLLSNLYRALAAHPWLADALRTRYPAALIDEFQDTDPLQFAIFSRIFAPAGPLFLVGDPKQAIYSFRAADLHTYLAARAAASACYTLAVNQRSTAPIVEACNRLVRSQPAGVRARRSRLSAGARGRAAQAAVRRSRHGRRRFPHLDVAARRRRVDQTRRAARSERSVRRRDRAASARRARRLGDDRRRAARAGQHRGAGANAQAGQSDQTRAGGVGCRQRGAGAGVGVRNARRRADRARAGRRRHTRRSAPSARRAGNRLARSRRRRAVASRTGRRRAFSRRRPRACGGRHGLGRTLFALSHAMARTRLRGDVAHADARTACRATAGRRQRTASAV